MKYFALLSVAIVVCVDATAVLHGGSSVVQRSDDGHGNYAFAYKEQHGSGGTSRSEKGGPGYASGSYTLNDHDGRQRVVNYVADAHGFRAAIKTNEPGVDSKEDPASVSINGGKILAAPIGYAEPLAYAAPAKILAGPIGYAEPELRGYGGLGYGGAYGVGHGIGGPLGSYSVKVNHVGGYAAPELGYGLGAKLVAAPIAYGYGGGYGKW